jgi:hypothetical protein
LAWKRGCRTGSDLIAQVTRVSGVEARRRARLGGLTRPRQEMGELLPPLFPAVAAGLFSGGLGVDAAEVIVSGLEKVAPRADVARRRAGGKREAPSGSAGSVTASTRSAAE